MSTQARLSDCRQGFGVARPACMLAAGALGAMLVAWPAIALLAECIAPTGVAAGIAVEAGRLPVLVGGSDMAPATAIGLLFRSLVLALGAALVGTLLVWPASRVLRSWSRTGDRAGRPSWATIGCTAVILLPLAVPPWLSSSAVWLSLGPGTWVGDLAESQDAVGAIRLAALAASLVAWSAALALATLVFARDAAAGRATALAKLDGLGCVARVRAAFADDAPRLCAGIAAATLFLMCETTVFDLAQVQTYGFELRVRDALGASHREVLAIAAPVMALALLGVVLLPRLLAAAGGVGASARAARSAEIAGLASRRRASIVVACALPSVLAVSLLRALWDIPRAGDFLKLHGQALATTMLVAAGASLLAALLACLLRVELAVGGALGRRFARMLALAALFAAVVPGTVAAGALESAYNRNATAAIYDTPVIVVLLLALRAMAVGSVVVLLHDAVEARSARRLRALDGGSAAAVWIGTRGELARTVAVVLPLAFAWSLGELTASGRLAPPGMPWLATDILNAIHYQRPETVLLGAAVVLAVGAMGAWVAARMVTGGASWRGRATAASLLLAGVLSVGLAVPGCAESPSQRGDGDASGDPSAALDPPGFDRDAPEVARLLPVEASFAGVGRGPGQFNGPRVVACDLLRGEVFVIDKDARVQRFDRDGRLLNQWRMPKTARGKPVGATVAPDGSLVVLDTHEHRVVAFSPEGTELWTLGTYGREPGQFIYPTDVAFAPDGRMFIAEYGGHDRIQVFAADRSFLYAFGSCGIGEREFLRPQALAYDAERDELYVVDTGNHRIAVFTGDGEFRRAIGGLGREEGRFAYPFGVSLEIDGVPAALAGGVLQPRGPGEEARPPRGPGRRTILVAENSNHRVQRLDAGTGEVLAVAGGIGRGDGRLKYPWAVEPAWAGPDGVWRSAVCDHGNSRILFFALPDGRAAEAGDAPVRESGR